MIKKNKNCEIYIVPIKSKSKKGGYCNESTEGNNYIYVYIKE